ncbi:MAG: hypothetical protein K8H90_06060, partial [Thermoanaerobaculia bacterium]|nr:hypothetical protein [Thermoanaerobaculia bacterium]
EEQAQRLRASFTAVRDLLAMVAGVEGRVALLWGGGGFQTDPAENLYRMLQSRVGGSAGAGPDLRRDQGLLTTQNRLDYARLLKTVNASRVTVYSIFAGAGRSAGVSAEIGGSAGVDGPPLTLDSPESGSSLAAFATETGGRSFIGAPDLAERLGTARTDLATYYSLGYHPLEGDSDGFHEVRVRVKREDARVLHRRGVQERKPEDVASDAATSALLAEAPPANPFGARVEVGEPVKPKAGRGRLVPIVVRVPMGAITLLPDGAVHRAHLAFHFSIRDPDGGFRRLEARPLDFAVPNDKLAAALGQAVAFQVDLQLEPGEYRLGAAVVDKLGGATSVATTAFRVTKGK